MPLAGHGLRPLLLRRRAGRPELKRDPLGGSRIQRMRKLLPWILLFATTAAIDVAVRFAMSFELRRVLLVEAVLFLMAAGIIGALARRSPQTGWRHVLQWVIAGGLILAALRAGLWAAGLPVARANLVIAGLGASVLILLWMRWRSQQRAAVAMRGAGDPAA